MWEVEGNINYRVQVGSDHSYTSISIYEYIIIIWNLFYQAKNGEKKIVAYFIPFIIQTME